MAKVKCGISFYTDAGEKFFGEGPYQLLCGIRRLGSLRAAAQEMGMAYTKAFRLMQQAEAHGGFPLSRRTIGGRRGGGSVLTPEAEELLSRYEAFKSACTASVSQLYQEHFSDFWPCPSASEECRREP